jgi:hypothetical protein
VYYFDLQVLDFLPELFDILKDQSYMLTEAEAAIFLPCLIEKVWLVQKCIFDVLS